MLVRGGDELVLEWLLARVDSFWNDRGLLRRHPESLSSALRDLSGGADTTQHYQNIGSKFNITAWGRLLLRREDRRLEAQVCPQGQLSMMTGVCTT